MKIRAWVGLALAGVWMAGTGGAMAQYKEFGRQAPQFGNQDNAPNSPGRSGYNVDTNNPMLLIFPGLREAPSPDWVKPGMRLTFYSASATIPGSSIAGLYQDPQGRWVDPNTGETYRMDKSRGSAGHGYNQVDVLSVNEDATVCTLRAFGIDLLSNQIRPLTTTGFTSLPGAAGDWWMNPDVLNQTVDGLNSPGIKVARIPYKAADKQYNAVWINTSTQGGTVSQVIDLESGLTLHYGSSHTSGPDGVSSVNGVPTRIGGQTMIGQTTFVDMRQLDFPWMGMELPRSIAQVQQLVYEGEMSMSMQGITTSFPMRVTFNIVGRGPDFVQIKRTIKMDMRNGTPPQEDTASIVSGTNHLLPICIPPRALGQLRNGQEIDSDPFTKTRTFVSFIGQDQSGNQVLTLTEINDKAVRTDYVYEMDSGILSALQQTDQNLNTQNTLYRVQ